MNEIEVWKDISGAEGIYQVSNLGRVRRLQSVSSYSNHLASIERIEPARIMKQRIGRAGYLVVDLRIAKKSKHFFVHRLVCAAFHGNRGDGLQCAHLDGSRTNNKAWNLIWATPTENMRHKEMHGTVQEGEANGSAKLSLEQVRQIIKMRCDGATLGQLSKQFGSSRSNIHRIVRGEIWKCAA